MSQLLRRVRRWWRPTPSPSVVPVVFQVDCLCGHHVKGTRLRQHQVLRCQRCGGNVFVLPVSPLPSVPGAAPIPAGSPPSSAPGRRRTSRRLLAGFAVFFVLLAGLLIWLPFVLIPSPPPTTDDSGGPGAVAAKLQAAGHHLNQGEVALTLADLKALNDWERRRPDWFSSTQLRQLRQLRGQAEILADLLHVPLENLLRQAAAQDPEEWQAQLARHYRGKAFVLDAIVQVFPGGRVEHGYRLWWNDQAARLHLDNLLLLHSLPLKNPQRILLACRLADVRRAPQQPWTVTVQENSGILLTEPGASHICGLDPRDPEVRQLLERQARWLAEK